MTSLTHEVPENVDPEFNQADHHHEPLPTGIKRWIFTTNHKDIGTLYLWFSFIMFLTGGAMAMGPTEEVTVTPDVDVTVVEDADTTAEVVVDDDAEVTVEAQGDAEGEVIVEDEDDAEAEAEAAHEGHADTEVDVEVSTPDAE